MIRLVMAFLLVLISGCGPSREVQYLQAAEEAKVEEKKLADLEAELRYKNSVFDLLVRPTEEELNAILDKHHASAGNGPGLKALTRELLDSKKKEYQKESAVVDEAVRAVDAQRAVVSKANARRDALAIHK